MQNSRIFKEYVNEKRLLNNVKEVSNFHRIQASTMFKEAADHVMVMCEKLGLNAKLLEYEANPDVWYLQSKMFKEWTCKEATFDIVDPDMRLCDYTADPISVVQKSYPIDLRDTPVDLVLLDKGGNPKDYEDVDLNGKWVFIRGWLNQYDWIYEKGALGLVTDFIMESPSRSRSDLYESMTYTSYWHKHTEGEAQGRGFVLSPKAGDKLAALCKQKWEKEHAYLQVKPYINSALYNGHIQDIEITIDGQDDKIVYLTAHLCHPRSACNDNASGVAATLEAMHVINTLVKDGKIAKPKHTIKCLLMPEFTGTFPYLAENNDYSKALGALNLDMVGGKQTRFYGPITLTKTPLCTPSMINELTSYALHEAAKESYTLSGDPVALTNYSIEAHSGGSDHTIYCDPTINIPCCMLGQWPDLNYHTATDTLDVIDPAVLKFSTLTAVNFAYNLANLTFEDLPYLFFELEKNIMDTKSDLVKAYMNKSSAVKKVAKSGGLPFASGEPEPKSIDKDTFGSMMFKLKKYYIDSIKTVGRLVGEEVDTTREEKHIANMFDEWIDFYGAQDSYVTYPELTTVYKRDFVGPIQGLDDYRAVGKGDVLDAYNASINGAGRFEMMGVQGATCNYIDGKRTLAQVVREVSIDLGTDSKDNVVKYVECLKGLGLISEVK